MPGASPPAASVASSSPPPPAKTGGGVGRSPAGRPAAAPHHQDDPDDAVELQVQPSASIATFDNNSADRPRRTDSTTSGKPSANGPAAASRSASTVAAAAVSPKPAASPADGTDDDDEDLQQVVNSNASAHTTAEPGGGLTKYEHQILGYKEGRELYYTLQCEALYTPVEKLFIERRFTELDERVEKVIAPRVVLACDHNLHFLANAVLLTLLGCEVEGCRDIAASLSLAAPQTRPDGYTPPSVVIIEKTRPAVPVDFSMRDMLYNIRSRDASYTRESGFVSRTNIIAIEGHGTSLFDVSPTSADLVLRGTLFRNMGLLRNLLLPQSVRNQGRLRVHRATSNFQRIERLLVAAPVEPDLDGNVHLHDHESQALAAQRLAGGLEEEVLYLKEVVRQRDKELKSKDQKLQQQVMDSTEHEHLLAGREATAKKANEELEETNARLKSQLQRTQMENRGLQHQLKLLEAQHEQKVRMQRMRAQTKGHGGKHHGGDQDADSPSRAPDPDTSSAMLKMQYNPRIDGRRNADVEMRAQGTQCMLVGRSISDPAASPPGSPKAGLAMSVSRVFGDTNEIPVVEEVIDMTSSKKTYEDLEAEIDALKKRLSTMEIEVVKAREVASKFEADAVDAATKLKTAVLERREAVGVADKLRSDGDRHSFELGRLEEQVTLAKEGREAAESKVAELTQHMGKLKSERSMLHSRLTDDEGQLADQRVAMQQELDAKVLEAKQQIRAENSRQRAKDLVAKAALLAALTKRTDETKSLQKLIAAADSRAAELQEMVEQLKDGPASLAASAAAGASTSGKPEKAAGGKGGAKGGKAAAGGKPQQQQQQQQQSAAAAPAPTKKKVVSVGVEPDPNHNLAVLFERQAAMLLEVNAKADKLETMYREARALVKPLESEMHTAREDARAAKGDKATAEAALATVEEQLKLARGEAEHYRGMHTKSKDMLADQKTQLHTLNKALLDARNEASESRKEVELGALSKQQTMERVTALEADLSKANSEAKQAAQQLALSAAGDEQNEAVRRRYESRLDEQMQKTATAENLVISKARDVAALQRQVKDLRAQVVKARSAAAAAEAASPTTASADGTTAMVSEESSVPRPAPSDSASAPPAAAAPPPPSSSPPPPVADDGSPAPGAADDGHQSQQPPAATAAGDAPLHDEDPSSPLGPDPDHLHHHGAGADDEHDLPPVHHHLDDDDTDTSAFGKHEASMRIDSVSSPLASSAAASPHHRRASKMRTVTVQRLVVGDVDETVLDELKNRIADLEGERDAAEEKLRNYRKELGESRGMVGAYKESQFNLLKKANDQSEELERAKSEVVRLESMHEAMLAERRRLAATREKLVETFGQWVLALGDAAFDVEDDGSEAWSLAASQHYIEQAMVVLNNLNRIQSLRTIEDMTQTPNAGVDIPLGGQAAPDFDDAAVQSDPPPMRDAVVYYNYQPKMADADIQVDERDLPAPPPATPESPASRPIHSRGGAAAAGPTPSTPGASSAVGRPPAGHPDPTMRDVSSRQLDSRSRRHRTTSRDRATRRPLPDGDREVHSRRSSAVSGGGFGEVLFESESVAVQTDDSLLEGFIRRRASSATGDEAPADGTPKPISLEEDLNLPSAEAEKKEAEAAAATAKLRERCEELESTLERLREEHAAELAKLQRPEGHDEGNQTPAELARQPSRAVGLQVGGHRASHADDASRLRHVGIQAVEDEQLAAGASAPNVAALSKLVAGVAVIHRALHGLFMKAKIAIPTASDLHVPPVGIVGNSRTALEALNADSSNATTLTECMARYVKSRRLQAVREQSDAAEHAKAARGGYGFHAAADGLPPDGADGAATTAGTSPPSTSGGAGMAAGGARANRRSRAAAAPPPPVYKMADEPQSTGGAATAGGAMSAMSFAVGAVSSGLLQQQQQQRGGGVGSRQQRSLSPLDGRGAVGGGARRSPPHQQQQQQQVGAAAAAALSPSPMMRVGGGGGSNQAAGFSRSLSPPASQKMLGASSSAVGGGRALPPMAATPQPKTNSQADLAIALGAPVAVPRRSGGQPLPAVGSRQQQQQQLTQGSNAGPMPAAASMSAPRRAAAAAAPRVSGGATSSPAKLAGKGGAPSSKSPSPVRKSGFAGGSPARGGGVAGRAGTRLK